MPTSPAWLALLLFALCCGYGLVLAHLAPAPSASAAPRRMWWGGWLAALAAGMIAVLVTLPYLPPWAPGARMGLGIAMGALTALLGAALAPRLPYPRETAASPAPLLTLFGLAGVGLSVVLLAFWGYPQPALYGFALGMLVVGATMRLALARLACLGEAGEPATWWVEAFCLFGATAAVAVLLATLRFDTLAGRTWWAAVLLMAALVPFSWGLVSAIRQGVGLPAVGRGSAAWSVLALLAAAYLVSWLTVGQWLPADLVLGGLVFFWLAAALLAGPLSPGIRGLAAALVVLGLLVAAYRLLAGTGEGLALLAGWLVILALAAGPAERRSPLLLVLTIGLVSMGYRLLSELAGFREEAVASMHYGFVGLLLGLAVPLIVGEYASTRPDAGGRLREAWPALLAGLLSVLLVPAVMLIWGFRALFGVVAGLAGALFVGLAAPAPGPRPVGINVALLALLAGVAGPFLHEVDLTRLARAYVLAGTLLLALVLLAGSWVAGRWAQRRG